MRLMLVNRTRREYFDPSELNLDSSRLGWDHGPVAFIVGRLLLYKWSRTNFEEIGLILDKNGYDWVAIKLTYASVSDWAKKEVNWKDDCQ